MANFLANVLNSGDYSDLTLVCEGQEFQVHKAIVCAQSPVLATALKGGFKEAKTNTFHVADFDPTTVKCMLDYMYTGKYEQMPPGFCDDNKDQAQATENDKNKSSSGTWIYHGLVNCIADYFWLPELAKMATVILDRLTQEDWSEDAFCDLLYGTHGRTRNSNFRIMLATRATDHIGELTARGLFNGVDPPSDDLTPTILRLCVQRLDVLRSGLEAETAKANAQSKNLKTIASVFNRLGTSCCGDCGGTTRCSIERFTKSSESSYKIRCGHCRREQVD
ncbi:BTB/POZ protein [Xylaria castorea]|nr:BTB/POZ protein [Xylaria castorea]